MYFKRLELVGFKSFCNKTVLNFEPGITAIVGPNGCGKSNIFDAIRWVLGEQSVKSLRGSEMQDVIFNGTDSKEPLSLGEVSVTFDNKNRFFNLDHPEVMITRRIFRSGESEYLLNKTQVRLKDITDLLMGTGIGAESYSLVQQGKIDLVLSSRPEDRRLVFDEAAGITKYKTQKREALRKLEETEQNLLRVNDIITEVKRQIGSLERQANKARRYKEIFDELKQKEINLAVLDKNDFIIHRERIISQLNDLQTAEEKLLEMLQLHESNTSAQREELKVLQEKMISIREGLLNLENTISSSKERINFNQEKISETQTNRGYLQDQVKQTKNRLGLNEEKLNNLRSEHNTISKNIEEKKMLLREKEEYLENLGLSTRSCLDNITKTKRGILELVTQISQIKNTITDLTGRQQVYMARKKRLDVENLKINEEKTGIETELNGIGLELTGLEKEFNALGLKINQAEGRLKEENVGLGRLVSDTEILEKEKLTLLSHREFLEKLKTKYDDISESMNATIYLDRQPREKISGLVIKVRNLEHLHLNQTDTQNPSEARIKLSGEAKPIDLDVHKINAKLQEIEFKLKSLEDNKSICRSRIEGINRDLANLQEARRNQETALADKRASHKMVLEKLNKIKEEREIIALELSDLRKEASELESKLQAAQSRLLELEKQEKESQELITNEQNKINSNNSLKEETRVIIAQTKAELQALSKRMDSDQITLKIMEDTYKQDKDALFNLEKQLKENEEKKESFILGIQDLENRIHETHSEIESQNKNLKSAQARYEEVYQTANEATSKIEDDRKQVDEIKNKLHELQMENKDVDFKLSGLKERIMQVYKVDLDAYLEMPSGIDKVLLAQEIEQLKQKLDACGNVNLVAIEEYDELKKRYDFLIQQQDDLVTAKESIHEAITKINRTTKKMFLETFEKVQQEFRNYFRLLFNGGDAQVFLVDEQDPLESGIEIICRPPGKKLQNILLLSGGEKSMAAIALVFAIFKIKPSPFCVLDEIDAALDEANVDRFSRILQEFTRDSQFIVITHNKRTIANADVMYGITMEESGVSKIVSVKLGSNSVQVKEEDKEPQAIAEPV